MSFMGDFHSAIVHFPIAAIVIAAVLNISSLIGKSRAHAAAQTTAGSSSWQGIETTIRILLWIALAGVVSAYFSGHAALDRIISVIATDSHLTERLEQHALPGRLLLWLLPITLLTYEFSLRATPAGSTKQRWMRGAATGLLLLAAAAVSVSGYRGGELIHDFGLGTRFFNTTEDLRETVK